VHAAPPDLVVFDEPLAPNFQGDRAASKAYASARDSVIREQAAGLEYWDVATGSVIGDRSRDELD
jgi:hypothetical protein